VLGELNRSLGKLYASEGRPIPPEQLLSALLLQVFRAVFFRSAAAGTLDWGEGQPADVSLAGAVHASTNAPVNYFDTPAILPGALIERRLEAVGAVAYDVFGIALEAGALQYRTERDACPLPDATPALYAIVTRNLRARRHGAQIGERQMQGMVDETANVELPIFEARLGQDRIGRILGLCRPVGSEMRRDIRLGKLLRERSPRQHEPLRVLGQSFRASVDHFEATMELGRSERTTMRPLLRPLWSYGVDAANTLDRKPR
jgi:hypothetical protein